MLVCDRCGKEEFTCEHQNDEDYSLQDKRRYDHDVLWIKSIYHCGIGILIFIITLYILGE